MIDTVKKLLQEGGCSLAVANGEVRTFSERGISALYRLLSVSPALLRGASVADKVVGKGAAALMVLGGVKELYAGIVSTPALELLERAGIRVDYGERVPQIRNRARTGFCPVESLCRDALTAEECLPLIESFINSHPEHRSGETVLHLSCDDWE